MTEQGLVKAETVSLPVSVSEALRQWNEYQELTRQLLNETDYQDIGKIRFKKKSAWRKYARAFNISDRVSQEEIKRDNDGFPIWARIRVEASAPNGRTAEADHECHVSERCCPAARGHVCDKAGYEKHTCCPQGCDGRIHWSHPGDLPATALTRAKNRAISDLIGAGEVSAEEMEGQHPIDNVAKPRKGQEIIADKMPCPKHPGKFLTKKVGKHGEFWSHKEGDAWCNYDPTKAEAKPEIIEGSATAVEPKAEPTEEKGKLIRDKDGKKLYREADGTQRCATCNSPVHTGKELDTYVCETCQGVFHPPYRTEGQ